jgi:hypothetical protein
MSVVFIDGFDHYTEEEAKTKWEFSSKLTTSDMKLDCGLHITVDKVRPAVIRVDDIDKAQCSFDSNGELSSITVTKPENGIIMIDSMEKLLEIFGKPDAVVSYDIETMYPHVIRVGTLENIDTKMQQPYVQGLDYITIDFKTVRKDETNVIEDEEDPEEDTEGLCDEMPLICRSQWDSIRSWEHTLFGVAPDGVQGSRPLHVHPMHTVALQQRLLVCGSENEQETCL